MHTIIILLASALASFIGSLQLGPVNLFVIDTTLNKNKASAYCVAFGGMIPEFIYCTMAVYFGTFFTDNPTIFIAFKVLLIVILAVVGVVFFFKKHRSPTIESEQKKKTSSKIKYFLKGFTLAALNPQLLPYWLVVMVYFNSIKLLEFKSEFDQIAFIFGSGLGAMILLIFIIVTIKKFKIEILRYLNNKFYFKAIGMLFFAISLQQLFTLL